MGYPPDLEVGDLLHGSRRADERRDQPHGQRGREERRGGRQEARGGRHQEPGRLHGVPDREGAAGGRGERLSGRDEGSAGQPAAGSDGHGPVHVQPGGWGRGGEQRRGPGARAAPPRRPPTTTTSSTPTSPTPSRRVSPWTGSRRAGRSALRNIREGLKDFRVPTATNYFFKRGKV